MKGKKVETNQKGGAKHANGRAKKFWWKECSTTSKVIFIE